MATEVIMPKFGMAQEEGQVIQWLKQEGESVQEGEPLLEVMTDKVTMEVESPASGILVGVMATADEIVPVAEIIAYIIDPGETFKPPTEPGWRKVEASPAQPAAELQDSQAITPSMSTPVARRMAAELGLDLGQVSGTGRDGKVTRTDVLDHLTLRQGAPGEGSSPVIGGEPLRAAPNARRLANQFQLDLNAIDGTGPGGRIQGEDVIAHLRSTTPSSKRKSEPEIVPLNGVRRTIVERMTRSAQTAPHITLEIQADAGRALSLQAAANERGSSQDQERFTLTSLWIKITAWVLLQHPYLNASFQGDSILLHPEIHIGIATAMDGGLIVPVIHDADRKDLVVINQELRDLTRRARSRTLKPEQVAGGTFTITNLGMFGITRFAPIINPPESGILAIGAIQHLVVVGPDGQTVSIRPMMNLTLAADHRVIDGAGAARFLKDLQQAIQDPGLLLL